MKNMIKQFYLMRPFTNLHVGSGETNYGVIDNLIERDACTGFPCVNSSGIKGAIKQAVDTTLDDSPEKDKLMRSVFGSTSHPNKSPHGETEKEANTAQGSCFFLPAQLLAIPVRSNNVAFALATSNQRIKDFFLSWQMIHGTDHSLADSLDLKNDAGKGTGIADGADLGQTGATVNNGQLDSTKASSLRKLLGNTGHPIVVLSEELMVEICDDLNLPVIARNQLEDGMSRNLWYEQVLPRESLLWFPIMWENETLQQKIESVFNNGLPLQVGGNASVGYGFTQITKMV